MFQVENRKYGYKDIVQKDNGDYEVTRVDKTTHQEQRMTIARIQFNHTIERWQKALKASVQQ